MAALPVANPPPYKPVVQSKKIISLGLRWPVERTNRWLTNYGQLRRNTDRHVQHRVAQLDLAISLILIVKLVKWANRWHT